MVKAIIFDLDGVLAKTDSLHYFSWKKICENHHFQFDKDLNNSLRGVSREECLNIILRYNKIKLNDVDFKKICEEESNNYNLLIANISTNDLMPGALNVLKTIKAKGIKMAIGSGSKHASFVIDKLEIRKYFDVIVDGNMIKNAKPDPECFIICSKLLKVEPVDTLVIEDADSGIIAANNGGFNSVSVRRTAEDVIADHYIDRLEEILLLIK
jgi:beta-phosphoglucomutase